ncbi:MAG: hypothetical protein CFE26_15725 [Verrucomicrobiales bacterium VVV1]|nr:MAG: hypothetical protein CFE26_15725 [Verrucomicrobiales bacterium VVV1]
MKDTPDWELVISKVAASPIAKLALLASAGNVKESNPPLAEALLLVAMVAAPLFKTAVMFGVAGIEPLATV